MDKEHVVYIYNGILFRHKKKQIMSFAATLIQVKIILLSKSERQILHDTTYMWNLKYDTSELIYETEIETQA